MERGFKFVCGFMLIAAIIINCSPKNKACYLPPINVEIPEILSNNPEIVSLISENSHALNLWSIKLEDLVVGCTPFVLKSEAELTNEERTVYGKLMLEFVSSMGQFAVNVAEMQQSATAISNELNDEQLKAMNVINTIFETRISEIKSRYQDFGKEE